jgi:hypothetical protein
MLRDVRLPMLAGAEALEGAEDTVEMGQAVEAARVADVGDGVLRFGKLLLCHSTSPSASFRAL